MAVAPVVAGLVALSGAVSAISSIREGNAAAAAHRFNAETSLQQAQQERDAARLEEHRQRVAGRKALSSIRARAGASGITLEGSALDVLEESAINAEQDALLVRFSREQRANTFERQSVLDTFNAKVAKKAGYMGAASSILSTGAKLAQGV